MTTIFVTVGSTSFDALSRAVLQESFCRKCRARGFTALTLQHGDSGEVLPPPPDLPGFAVETFAYAPSLAAQMERADLILSHAGAGTILDALTLRKRLIVVANESLMDNHQLELADKLSREGYCQSATPLTLESCIEGVDTGIKTRLANSDGHAMNRIVREEMDRLSA